MSKSIFKAIRKLYTGGEISAALRVVKSISSRSFLRGGTPVYVASTDGRRLVVGTNTFKLLDVLRRMNYPYSEAQSFLYNSLNGTLSRKAFKLVDELYTLINCEQEYNKALLIFKKDIPDPTDFHTMDMSGDHMVTLTTISMYHAMRQTALNLERSINQKASGV